MPRSPVMALLAAVFTAGCQKYERAPLDLAAHREAFLARTPEAAGLVAFTRDPPLSSVTPRGHFDLSDGIGPEEAESIALVYNADLRVSRLRAGVTLAAADHAGAWEDPVIGVDLTRILESAAHPWKVFGTVALTIPISGRLDIEKQRAGLEHAAELVRIAEQEWGVRMAVRRAWADWRAADARLDSEHEHLRRVESVLTLVDLMEQSGEMARTEARLVRIEHAARGSDLRTIESSEREARRRIIALMGLSPIAPISLAETGSWRAGGPVPAESADTLRTRLESRSPRLLTARAEYEVAEKVLEREVRAQYPDLTLGPGYGREDGQDQLLLGIGLPLPIFNANRGGIAEARARREVAAAGAEATHERLLSELEAAAERLRGAADHRQALERDVVPLVEAQYADVREVARLGEVSTLILLEALNRLQEVKTSLIEAQRDIIIAEIDIEEIIGPEPAAEESRTEPSRAAGNGDNQ